MIRKSTSPELCLRLSSGMNNPGVREELIRLGLIKPAEYQKPDAATTTRPAPAKDKQPNGQKQAQPSAQTDKHKERPRHARNAAKPSLTTGDHLAKLRALTPLPSGRRASLRWLVDVQRTYTSAMRHGEQAGVATSATSDGELRALQKALEAVQHSWNRCQTRALEYQPDRYAPQRHRDHWQQLQTLLQRPDAITTDFAAQVRAFLKADSTECERLKENQRVLAGSTASFSRSFYNVGQSTWISDPACRRFRN